MDLENLRLCKGCVHHNADDYCNRTLVTDYVHGKHGKVTCSNERAWDVKDGCGPSAKFFEPKDKQA